MRAGLFIFFTSLMLTSCSKSVFVHRDTFGVSKYVLYKDNYKYIEKTKDSDFKIWGKYELTDSTIVFVCKEEDKIPYNYLLSDIQLVGTTQDPGKINLLILHKSNEEPVQFATVLTRDIQGNLLDDTDTGFDGIAILDRTEAVHLIEINCLYSKKLVINYHEMDRQDMIVKIQEPRKGGRMSEGCLIHYIDYLLEYEIDDKYSFEEFGRKGKIYIKE